MAPSGPLSRGYVRPGQLGSCKTRVSRVYGKYYLPESTYISCPSGRLHYFGELYRRDDFLPPAQAPFEGRLFNIPRHPEVYLERLYGDWRQIPPEDQRELHAYEELDV